MLENNVIPIDFGKGVDTKTDPKAVVAGKLLRLENAVFTAPNQISKRPGGTALGTSTAPVLTFGYGADLIKSDSGTLYSYSSNQDAWISRGSHNSVELSRSLISEQGATSGVSDMAIFGNYAIYGWSDFAGPVYASVVDLSTNTVLVKQTVYNAVFVGGIKCACLGGTTLSIAYQKSSLEWFARTVTFSGAGVVTFSNETQITTNSNGGSFDLIETATGGAFVYINTSADVVTATLSTALAVSSATIATTVGLSYCVTISKTSNNNIWVYWTEATDDGAGNLTALTIYYAVYSSALAVVLARTSIVATAAPYYVSNLIAKADSATQETLYYGLFKTNNNGAKHEIEYTNYITITSAGVVGAATLFANGVVPFSHPFTVSSKIYSVFAYRGSDITVAVGANFSASAQTTLFVLELTNLQSPPLVVSRFASGTANTEELLSLVVFNRPNVASFSSTKFYATFGIIVQDFDVGNTQFISGGSAVFAYAFDFNSANANMAVAAGQVAILNGGVMQLYDGSACTEFGFHLFPEITNLSVNGAGGSIADGTYSYLAVFQWIDAQGNLHQSATSLTKNVAVATGTGTSTVTATVTTNFLSRKTNAWIALFRTTGVGSTGSIYYQVSAFTSLISADSSTNAVTTIADTLADASITSRPQAYTFPASTVLENTTPPPSMILVAHNNRLIFVDSENPNTYWYTKSFSPLIGLSPSAFLTENIDPTYGNIAALAEMDEKLVIFKQTGIFIQSGDGANDTGQNSSLSFPQIVPSDVGVSQLKGVIATPTGVMFKSANGIYILNRALNVSYIGAEVESYNSQTITGAVFVPGKSQIRFLCSGGKTLVYDYIFNQWSTFTYTGTACSTWNSLFVYSNGSVVLKDAATTYTDNGSAYALLAQTSWLHIGSIQGFQRVRRLIMLGDFTNGASASHNLSISAAYDFSTTFQTAITYAFGAAAASGVFQYRERLPIQKCDTISLLIQETTSGDSAETIDLTNISFEAAIKRGVNKLRGQQSVG